MSPLPVPENQNAQSIWGVELEPQQHCPSQPSSPQRSHMNLVIITSLGLVILALVGYIIYLHRSLQNRREDSHTSPIPRIVPAPIQQQSHGAFLIDPEKAIPSQATNEISDSNDAKFQKRVETPTSSKDWLMDASLDDSSDSRVEDSMSRTPIKRKYHPNMYLNAAETFLLHAPDCHSTPPTRREVTATRDIGSSSSGGSAHGSRLNISSLGKSSWNPKMSLVVNPEMTIWSRRSECNREDWGGSDCSSPLPSMPLTPSTPLFLSDEGGIPKPDLGCPHDKITQIDVIHGDIEQSYAEFLKMIADGVFDEPPELLGDSCSWRLDDSMVYTAPSHIDNSSALPAGMVLQFPDPIEGNRKSHVMHLNTRLISLLIRNLTDGHDDDATGAPSSGSPGLEPPSRRLASEDIAIDHLQGSSSRPKFIKSQTSSNKEFETAASVDSQDDLPRDPYSLLNTRNISPRYQSMLLFRTAHHVLSTRRRRALPFGGKGPSPMVDEGDADISNGDGNISRFSDSTFMSSLSNQGDEPVRSGPSLSLDGIHTAFDQNSTEMGEESSLSFVQ
ncbi:hypothetical protein FRC17_006573 [Serendipita sp. 399]|nr:hypothetical protein FRC17_006573 [Serendipita sp. 399]